MSVQPLVFEPIFKRIRWGGRRLHTVLGKQIGPESDYAESWEISDHGDDQSIVRSGTYAGSTLSHLVKTQNLPLLGSSSGHRQFPLLVKYLDANDVLSLQVHPDDSLAGQFSRGENGKTEAWTVIEAAPDSVLYAGLREGVAEADVREAIASGGLEDLLHKISVSPGDCVFVPAGTVHAIGAGVLLAEIQQSSDITFRLFDWDRRDPGGRPRELHIEQAIRCIDFSRGPVEPVRPRGLASDHVQEELVDSEFFAIHRHKSREPFGFPLDDHFHVLMVLQGAGVLSDSQCRIPLPTGQTVLLPADRNPITITPESGELTLLDAFLPPSPPA